MKSKLLLLALCSIVVFAIGCSGDDSSPTASDVAMPDGVTYSGVSATEARIAAEAIGAPTLHVWRSDEGQVVAASRTGDRNELYVVNVFARTAELLLTVTGTERGFVVADGEGELLAEMVDGEASTTLDKQNIYELCRTLAFFADYCCRNPAGCTASCQDMQQAFESNC